MGTSLAEELAKNKPFREQVMRRCILARSKSKDILEINIYNTILNYIYDLDYRDAKVEKHEKDKNKGGNYNYEFERI